MPEADIERREDRGEDHLVANIEQTRAELARTIDQIADRLNPANAARRTADNVKERVARIDPVMAGGAAVVLVSATVLYLLVRGKRRQRR